MWNSVTRGNIQPISYIPQTEQHSPFELMLLHLGNVTIVCVCGVWCVVCTCAVCELMACFMNKVHDMFWFADSHPGQLTHCRHGNN